MARRWWSPAGLGEGGAPPWAVVYVAAGAAMCASLLRDAYARAASVCELFPEFSFAETLREELLLHHTRLPVTRAPVPTPALLAAYALGFLALRLRAPERLWLLLRALCSGQWLLDLLFVHLPH